MITLLASKLNKNELILNYNMIHLLINKVSTYDIYILYLQTTFMKYSQLLPWPQTL